MQQVLLPFLVSVNDVLLLKGGVLHLLRIIDHFFLYFLV